MGLNRLALSKSDVSSSRQLPDSVPKSLRVAYLLEYSEDDEIQRMVKDAEAHADEDRRFRELVDARNQADGMIHATQKSMADLGEQVGEQEKGEIESAIKALETAVAGDDKAEIEAKTQALAELSGKLAERVYQKSQDGDGSSPGTGGNGDAGPGAGAGADDVVDAEFEEVRDERR